MLGVWLSCKHNCSFALHVLGLGFLLLRISCWNLEEGEASLLSPGAFGRQVEQLQRCAQVFMDCQLLFHLDVTDAIRKG